MEPENNTIAPDAANENLAPENNTVVPDVATETVSNEDVINSLLGEYNKPAETTKSAPDTADDLSDPKKYYQTGAKKGQPKKARGVKLTPNDNNAVDASFKLSNVLTGGIFIVLIDMIFPLILETVHNIYLRKKGAPKMDARLLQMSADQRKQITPIADELVKCWNIEAHPAVLLLFAFAGVYGMNYIQARDVIVKEETK